jgi:serine phosphatase RsbU (regulator of sigma subunit)
MPQVARLSVKDSVGRRTVPVSPLPFTIGRRTTAGLQIISRDVSREHAAIACEQGTYVLSDAGSRFGTFLNGAAVTAPRPLSHGDRIQLGQSDEIELEFLLDTDHATGLVDTTEGFSDFRQMAAILNGLRALGSGRVLDEVLTLVLDSALDVTAAERGFVMLADASGQLNLRVARGRHKQMLSGIAFSTSEKIPRQVFDSGNSTMVSDLLDGDLAGAHEGTVAFGIRHVLCVPLKVSAYSDALDSTGPRTIGVLYLDGRERGTLLSPQTRSSLDAFATQAALAIDSARLYAEAAEKGRLERDLRVAAEIQRALLPEPSCAGAHFDLAATSVPCRTIGGDFFDYLDYEGGLAFAVGDVAGKGPPAALLAAAVQSNFVAQAQLTSGPAETMAGINRALLRRAVEARFATMFHGILRMDGRLSYCNAGQEPPVLVQSNGRVEELTCGGPVIGLLTGATYESANALLDTGDLVVVCSDGVTEARNDAGDEYGRQRLCDLVATWHGADPGTVLDAVLKSVNAFAESAPQGDDLTVLVLRYRRPQPTAVR